MDKPAVEAKADSDGQHCQPDVQWHQLLCHLIIIMVMTMMIMMIIVDHDEDGDDDDLHIPPVSDGTDAENEESCG